MVDIGRSGYRSFEILAVLGLISSSRVYHVGGNQKVSRSCLSARAGLGGRLIPLSGSFFVPSTILMKKNKRMMYGRAGVALLRQRVLHVLKSEENLFFLVS
jgi:hypothetical protein